MTPESSGLPHLPETVTADGLLDALRDHPGWDEARVAEQFDRLIAGFPTEVLSEAIRPRLGDLAGGDGEVLIGLVEGLARPELWDALAEGLLAQPDLAPDRRWQALGALEGTGTIEARPALIEWREELDELIGGDDSLGELAAHIEDDPDSIAVAIEGLTRIEPDVRAEIIEGLAVGTPGPGVLKLLQALAESDDPSTRTAAGAALAASGHAGSDPIEASARPAAIEPEAQGGADSAGEKPEGVLALRETSSPRILHSAIGPLDAEGRGRIVLVVDGASGLILADFECDVRDGIRSAEGRTGLTKKEMEGILNEWRHKFQPDVVSDRHGPSLILLGGAAWLSGAGLSTECREWLGRALGPDFPIGPVFADPAVGDEDSDTAVDDEEDVRAILDARPDWRDDSDLLRGLAVEMALHDGDQAPDPERDPGPFRILFENRILGRVELYRRMLLWSAFAWSADGRRDLARAALRSASRLADPQNAVPGNPFLSAIMVRSLSFAQARAWSGLHGAGKGIGRMPTRSRH